MNISTQKSWHYQLQNFSNRLSQVKSSLIVIDYSKDGTENRVFTRFEIDKLKSKKNIVVSYMSIGEAEDYRFYFKNLNKDLIVNENKDWKGNFKIKYWEEPWQKIILGEDGYLKRILLSGFQGVYLDIVDAFQYYPPNKIKEKAQQMAEFIIKISETAKTIDPEFLIIIQNGENIVNYLKNKEAFFTAIDAVGTEDLFYYGKDEHNNPLYTDNPRHKDLRQYQNRGKPIFSVEYLTDDKKIEQFIELSSKYDYVPFVTKRALGGN